MKRVKTQTINVDAALWDEAKHLALRNHQESLSVVISQLLSAWNNSPNRHISIKSTLLKKELRIRRSLYCDASLWQETMHRAKTEFGKSGSHIIEVLLRNWVTDERKRKVENPKQAKLI
ncbi:MAG: hypothetical protein KU37_10205 [Sulfuricurvum sp. PC08-66]|nr:MAG: hypothetical protein KU37_10205 [Sulfuricurvum sp. PC08-66]